MTTTASMPLPAYPAAGKQPYYPHQLGPFTFPSLPNTYMYGGGCGGVGGGAMTLAHPTTVNGYSTIGGDLPSLGLNYELNGHAAESLVSAKQSQQTLDNQLSPPPPEDTPHLQRRRIVSTDERTISPIPPSASPTLLSPASITNLPMTTSAIESPPQQFIHNKPTFNVSATTNGLAAAATNGFPRLTQHHFPQNAFSHVPSSLSNYSPQYSSFGPAAAAAAHHTTLPNVVPLYQSPHPQQLDYPSSAAATFNPLLGNWSHTYPSSIHAAKLSYDSPRYKLTPERATPLQKWFDEHREHPYPTRHDKILLCQDTNLTFTQVSTWFANCRRRLKKATQEDEERSSTNNSSTTALHNSRTPSSAYQDEATPTSHTHRLSSRSPVPDSPCSSGHHDSEEKLHDYDNASSPPEDFALTYDISSRKSRGTPTNHH